MHQLSVKYVIYTYESYGVEAETLILGDKDRCLCNI